MFYPSLIICFVQVTEFLPVFQSDGDDENVHKLLKLRYNPESGQIVGKQNMFLLSGCVNVSS